MGAYLRCATLPGASLRAGNDDDGRSVLSPAVRVLRLMRTGAAEGKGDEEEESPCARALSLLRSRPTTSRRAQEAISALTDELARGLE